MGAILSKYNHNVIYVYYPGLKGSLKFILMTLKMLIFADQVIVQKRLFPRLFINTLSFFKSVYFDFDDAIYDESRLHSRRFINTLSKADKIFYCSPYTLESAWKHKSIQFLSLPPKIHQKHSDNKPQKLRIVWTGTSDNLANFSIINDALVTLVECVEHLELVIISNIKPSLGIKFKFVEWSLKAEHEEMLKGGVGIMPLTNNKYNSGKCAYKMLHYCSYNMPVVASAVGINSNILDDYGGMILVKDDSMWVESILEALKLVKQAQSGAKLISKLRVAREKSFIAEFRK